MHLRCIASITFIVQHFLSLNCTQKKMPRTIVVRGILCYRNPNYPILHVLETYRHRSAPVAISTVYFPPSRAISISASRRVYSANPASKENWQSFLILAAYNRAACLFDLVRSQKDWRTAPFACNCRKQHVDPTIWGIANSITRTL